MLRWINFVGESVPHESTVSELKPVSRSVIFVSFGSVFGMTAVLGLTTIPAVGFSCGLGHPGGAPGSRRYVLWHSFRPIYHPLDIYAKLGNGVVHTEAGLTGSICCVEAEVCE